VDSLVGSVLNYDASVWGYHEAKQIEQVNCKRLGRILKVKQSTNVYGLFTQKLEDTLSYENSKRNRYDQVLVKTVELE